MAYADAYGNIEGIGGDTEWDSAKLIDYIEQCQKKYDAFLVMSDTLIRNFQAVADDPDHTGPEAECTKAFMLDVQIPMVEDIVYTIQRLMPLHQPSSGHRSWRRSSPTSPYITAHLYHTAM